MQLVLHGRQHRDHQRLQQRERPDPQGQHRKRRLMVRAPASNGHDDLPRSGIVLPIRDPSKPES
jgi:hypothetical protein